jgi:N-acetylglucosaminyl-diphospho-decaprenol L-rhamnosyltransferase
MEISIVIISYNVRDYLLECLASVYAVDSIRYEVIVVDNASTDSSMEAVRSKFPQVIIIENKVNKGFPAANNQAFKIAKGNYIFMLNPDAVLYKGSLETLYNFLEKETDVHVVAPQLMNSDSTVQQSVWRYPTMGNIFSEMFYLKHFLKNKNYNDVDKTKLFEADSFSGAAILFRRSVMESIGMLDESLFWIEDVDFCYRAKKAGFKLMYYPGAQVLHHISKSAKTNYNISISNQVFNKIKFYKKYKSKGKVIFIILLSLYFVIIKLISFIILSPFSVIYRRKAKAYAYTLPRVIHPPASL